MLTLTAIEGCCAAAIHYKAGDSITATPEDASTLIAAGQCVMAGSAPTGGTGSTRLVIGPQAVLLNGPGSELLHPGERWVTDEQLATLWGLKFVLSPDIDGGA